MRRKAWKPAKSKYHSRSVVINGERFDSKKELERYCELCLLLRAGKIEDLQRQVKFVLIPAQYEAGTIGPRGGMKRGKLLERECSYYADFCYMEDGHVVVEDTKGYRTPEYIIKRKLMLERDGIRIREL